AYMAEDTDSEDSEGSSSILESKGEGEAEGLDMESVPRTLLFHVNHQQVHPSTPLAFLQPYATLGVVEVCVTSVEIDGEGDGEGEDADVDTPLGTIHFNTPLPTPLATLPPAFDVDPAAVIVSGDAV
ncbi:hypothetical protein KIPB_017148, partial [Kipferlia bialata]